MAGCPNGTYVEAAIMSGDLSAGMTNEVTAGLQAGDVASIRFDDHVGGEGFKLTKFSCR